MRLCRLRTLTAKGGTVKDELEVEHDYDIEKAVRFCLRNQAGARAVTAEWEEDGFSVSLTMRRNGEGDRVN